MNFRFADLDVTPSWFKAAVAEIGIREQPSNRGPAIRRFISEAHCGHEGDPWCAIFANAKLEQTGFRGTRSAASRSFTRDENFHRIEKPFYGCIVVYWRGHPNSGLGHVGFYNGEEGEYISTVGGNESDMVREEMFPKNSHTFGLIGFYQPAKFVRNDDANPLGPLPVLVPHGIKARSLKVT